MAAAAPALLIQNKKLVYISFPAPDGNSEGGSEATLGHSRFNKNKIFFLQKIAVPTCNPFFPAYRQPTEDKQLFPACQGILDTQGKGGSALFFRTLAGQHVIISLPNRKVTRILYQSFI